MCFLNSSFQGQKLNIWGHHLVAKNIMRGQIKSTQGKKKLDKLKIQIQVEKTFGDHFSSDIMLSALLNISHYQKSY